MPGEALSPEEPRIELGALLWWLEDPAGRLDLEAVRTLRAAGQFQPPEGRVPNFGFSESVWWFHVRLVNDSARYQRRLLEIGYPLLDDLRLFLEYSDKPPRRFLGGDRRPFDTRYIENTHFLFPIELAPGEEVDLYLRLHTSSATMLPAVLWQPEAFHSSDHRRQFADGLYYGALGMMLLFNIIVYLFIRDRYYPLYLGFLAAFILFHATLEGYAFEYLWPNSPIWNEKALTLFIPLSGLFVVLFIRAFLHLRHAAPKVDRLYRIAALGMVVTMLLVPFQGYGTSIRIETVLLFPMILLVLLTSLQLWRRGNRQAGIIFLSWLVLLVGIFLFLLQIYDMIPVQAVSLNAMKFGAVAQVIGFAIALLDRVRSIVEENRRMQAERSQRLEALVAERTAELNRTLEELAAVNRQLEERNNLDGLTGVRNRRFFDRHLREVWAEASAHGMPVSLLMIDLDHFKRVNDEHGHPAGDEALRLVARLLDQGMQRASDRLVRYGGEEFAAILPDTDLEGARQLAERLRQEVERHPLHVGGTLLRLTISVGVACVVPGAADGAERLLMLADHALYRAKANGRNRVEVAGEDLAGI